MKLAGIATVGEQLASTQNLPTKIQWAIEIALLVSVSAVFMFGLHGMTDSKYSMLLSENLLYHHTFVIAKSSVPHMPPNYPGYHADGYPYQTEENRGRLLYGYPVGSSVLSIPFVAAMNAIGISAISPTGEYDENGDRQIQTVVAAIVMAVLTVVFFRTALLFLPLSWSIVLALGGAFSTQIWSTASRVLWSHTWQLLLIGLAIYMLLSEEEGRAPSRPMVLGTILSFAYFVRPTSSIPIAAISLYLMIFRPKDFVILAITGAFWLFGFVLYSLKIWAHWLPAYYLFHLDSQHSWEAIAGDLISPSRGLFIYVPGSAFALLLVAYYWRVLTHRWMALLSLAIISVLLFVISTDPMWWGGHCYGARLTVDMVPWLFLLAVLGCHSLLNERRTALKHYAMALGLFTLVIGALMNGRGAISFAANDWVNGPPDVDQDSQRVWDWSDPQFLSGLISRRH
jgi:hypothetical protein